MMKQFAISAALAGGLFAGVLGAAGAAHATSDADVPYYGTVRHYDAYGPVPGTYDYDPYRYNTPIPGRYDYDVRCHVPANSIVIGPDGVSVGLPGGAVAAAGPGGVGYTFGC